MTETFHWGSTISHLLAGDSLDEEMAERAMTEIMEGAATPAQIAGFVIALRAKGETVDEVVGLVRTMRRYGDKVDVVGEVLDTCGTGGDRTGTFNVSTAAAIVCAGAGARVAKHGNRAASSKCGSADVLESLGVKIDLPPAGVATCLAEAGIGFCFAPVFHPAMRHAGATRRELGVPTIFNFLGPLTNPAGATRQALGVSDASMIEVMVEALGRLGSHHVIAFHGFGGLDELATAGPSNVLELKAGEVSRWTIDPTELGFETAPLEAIVGGTCDENAAIIRTVLTGKGGPASAGSQNDRARRDIVVLNAAAGLVAAGFAPDVPAGIVAAAEAIDSGRAAESLERLVAVSNS